VSGRVRELDAPLGVRRALATRPVVLRSVRPGDHVRVTGILQPLALTRDGAQRWSLAPATAKPWAIPLAYEGTPRLPSQPLRPVVRAAVATGAAVMIVLASIGAAAAARASARRAAAPIATSQPASR